VNRTTAVVSTTAEWHPTSRGENRLRDGIRLGLHPPGGKPGNSYGATMYRDTEQSYGDWTLDVYEANGQWHCDYWHRSDPKRGGTKQSRKKSECVEQAKLAIDNIEACR